MLEQSNVALDLSCQSYHRGNQPLPDKITAVSEVSQNLFNRLCALPSSEGSQQRVR